MMVDGSLSSIFVSSADLNRNITSSINSMIIYITHVIYKSAQIETNRYILHFSVWPKAKKKFLLTGISSRLMLLKMVQSGRYIAMFEPLQVVVNLTLNVALFGLVSGGRTSVLKGRNMAVKPASASASSPGWTLLLNLNSDPQNRLHVRESQE